MSFGPLYWDDEGLLTDQEGSIRISRRELEHLFSVSNVQQVTQRGASQSSIPRVNNSIVSQMLYAQSRLPPSTGASAHLRREPPSRSPSAQPQHQMSRPFNSWSRGHNNAYSAGNNGQNHQAPASFAGLANLAALHNNTAYPEPAPNQGDALPGAWLPDAPQEPNFPLPSNGNSAYLSDPNWWQAQQQPSNNHATQRRSQYPPPTHNLAVLSERLPPRQRPTPTIRVITEQLEPQAQPQDSHHTSATSLHTPYSYDSAPYIDQNNLYPLQRSFDGMADMEVSGPPPQQQVSQIGPNNNGIVSPISDHPAISRPMSPSNQQMVDPSIRKRSFSEMSQGQPPMQMIAPEHHQSPQASVAYEPSPGGLEDHGHKVQRSIKRGDPPQAHDGKYYCSFAPECADQYFDRKCEWSKHMDKHDRPYRCPQPQCAKLQGFTYSGGLLRHEREVHGKHGGPKEQLRCTVPECKRHSGKGFTRKENLNEHLRRVHGITTNTTTDASQLRQIAVDAAPGAELMETPASRFSETGEVDEFNAVTPAYPDLVKRRRLDAGGSPHNGPDDLELELQRLKADNLEKDERIRRMEENDAAREARMKSLEDKLAQLTNQGMQRVPEQANMGTYPDFDGSVEVMQQVQEP